MSDDAATNRPDLTVVIPLLDEEESLPELAERIQAVCEEAGISYEVVWIDDGSTDTSWSIIQRFAAEDPARHRGVKFRRNFGKSAALHAGFARARGRRVVTMDADLQDDPAEIPELLRMIDEDGYDLVSGWKKKRHDPISKTLPSKLFNRVTRMVSGIKLNDFNCGLKAYRAEVVKSIHVYGEMHRYIPVLAKWEGYSRIGEKPVQHHARKYGRSKFGVGRFLTGLLDLVGVTFLTRYARRPLHFFGALGLGSGFAGFAILLWLTIEWFLARTQLSDRPIILLGVLLVILGVQFLMIGLLGEMVIRPQQERGTYDIAEESTPPAEPDSAPAT